LSGAKSCSACRASPRPLARQRSLKQYVEDLKPNQTDIFYLTGESVERLKANPKLESAARAASSAAVDRSGRCILDLPRRSISAASR
jgi:HSP90 family molecular chaperone